MHANRSRKNFSGSAAKLGDICATVDKIPGTAAFPKTTMLPREIWNSPPPPYDPAPAARACRRSDRMSPSHCLIWLRRNGALSQKRPNETVDAMSALPPRALPPRASPPRALLPRADNFRERASHCRAPSWGVLILPALLRRRFGHLGTGNYDSLAGVDRHVRLQLCATPLGSLPECHERLPRVAAKLG